MPLLEVRGLRKSYGNKVAVNGVSFSVEQGEVFGLLGPNGAGKSTTMMMLAGLLVPDAGEIFLQGEPYAPHNPDHRRKLGVVPQDLAVYPDLTPLENLQFFGKLYGITGGTLQQRIAQVLDQVQLTGHQHEQAHTFSGGMKRRLNFAAALLHGPSLLILDEVTVGVDPQSRSHLMDVVRDLSHRGVGIIYASHYMEEVQAICSRVGIIDHGTMLVCDYLSRLLQQMSCDLCLIVTPDERLPAIAHGIADLSSSPDGQPVLTLRGEQGQEAQAWSNQLQAIMQRLAQAGISIRSVETRESNLERLFLQLTGRKLRD